MAIYGLTLQYLFVQIESNNWIILLSYLCFFISILVYFHIDHTISDNTSNRVREVPKYDSTLDIFEYNQKHEWKSSRDILFHTIAFTKYFSSHQSQKQPKIRIESGKW